MTVRRKLALTIFATGLVTALLVIATVIYAFQRFENETAFRRGAAFLQRVVATYGSVFDFYEQRPDEFQGWLRNMVLFAPDTELYLIQLDGTVLVTSGNADLPPGFKVRVAPVQQVLEQPDMPYVMGDDPERMDANAVIAVQPVRRTAIRNDDPVAGYLYLVLHSQQLPEGRWDALRSSFARPAMGLIFAIIGFTTLAAVLITHTVTRPLQRLTAAVSRLSERGLEETLAAPGQARGAAAPPDDLLPAATDDEFGQLTRAFEMMLATLRTQWAALRRLDHFRREGVSNLSHDLRSPLTATVACLETLESRWADGGTDAGVSAGARADAAPEPADDRRLVEVALRNTRNAARLVQSLGDLAQLDEPAFQLRTEVVDLVELLDDISLRFTARAAAQMVTVTTRHAASGSQAPLAPAFAAVDIQLFERAVANLVDNALKFCAAGGAVTLAATTDPTDARDASQVRISVTDTGRGIPEADLPHLFDRFYQSRQSVAPATGEGGRGLGLAIVKRITELHGGSVSIHSEVGVGTNVVLSLPRVSG